LQTPGGGAAVVFTDVEVVTQKSPGSRCLELSLDLF